MANENELKDPCRLRHCRQPAGIGYQLDGEIVGLCAGDWLEFARQPLVEGLAWLRQRLSAKKTAEVRE